MSGERSIIQAEVIFEIHGIMGFRLNMVEYPTLTSRLKWVRKGIDALKKYWPGLLRYLSRQQVLAGLSNQTLVIRVHDKGHERSVKRAFGMWMRRERAKNLVFMILEALVIPFTGFLAVLPGPNLFFYVPGLLLYFHYVAWRGLKKAEKEDLSVRIEYVNEAGKSPFRGERRGAKDRRHKSKV